MSVGEGWLDKQAGPVQGERAGGLVGVAGTPGKQLRSRPRAGPTGLEHG